MKLAFLLLWSLTVFELQAFDFAAFFSEQNEKIIKARDAYYLKKLGVYGGQILMPPQFRKFKNMRLVQLESSEQDAANCAWFSVYNAMAINTLLEHQKPISAGSLQNIVSEGIHKQLKKMSATLQEQLKIKEIFQGLYTKEKFLLARYFKLSNALTLDVDHDVCWLHLYHLEPPEDLQPFVKKVGGSYYEVEMKEAFLHRVTASHKAFHFLLSVPYEFGDFNETHAVLVSVIQREQAKPLVIYMDSNNSKLHTLWDKALMPHALLRFFKTLNKALSAS